MAINPATIDPLALPSVSLHERSQLPTTPCIYFAIDSQGVIQYVGKAKNLRTRWRAHDKGIELSMMDSVTIAYLEVDAELLVEIENALIEWFMPSLNTRKSIKSLQKRPFCLQIERVIRVDAPGIGAKIKYARERDPRSVEELAKAADMTRANWYRIEREENDVLPEPTLRKIEEVLGVDFGVTFDN
ncbi:helix-turn-helix transcriptional regulator [Nostoc sp. FACHB-280]|uniref:helix-turn-helix domain-containing protein n=1 Tax=Nostoc sp. FACHB-280 TaxID=2692839 RepID=UPI00168A6AD6|nr:helix-turn-helix transcriptional regulator [Nostoc sp. FACHB-280]MBD2497904.1 GIY-YIG nuclease family protein [Nostoc sp. FACHB-280]